jgi:hypothetical protein
VAREPNRSHARQRDVPSCTPEEAVDEATYPRLAVPQVGGERSDSLSIAVSSGWRSYWSVGGQGRVRSADLPLFRRTLSQLSYLSLVRVECS